MATNKLTLLDFAPVIYSAGRVFDGLCASDVATRSFLSTGSTEGITSTADLRLLKDLKALAEHVIARAGDASNANSASNASSAVDASYLIALNEQITESGPLEPGQLRTADQLIGVSPRYGRHEPPALTRSDLQQLLERSIGAADAVEDALAVFVSVARAQPFGDGNKRTALFAANALLLNNGAGRLLSVPRDENAPAVSDLFNDLLARAYVFGEDEGVKELLRTCGLRGEASAGKWTLEDVEELEDISAFDAVMDEEGENIPWDEVEADARDAAEILSRIESGQPSEPDELLARSLLESSDFRPQPHPHSGRARTRPRPQA